MITLIDMVEISENFNNINSNVYNQLKFLKRVIFLSLTKTFFFKYMWNSNFQLQKISLILKKCSFKFILFYFC